MYLGSSARRGLPFPRIPAPSIQHGAVKAFEQLLSKAACPSPRSHHRRIHCSSFAAVRIGVKTRRLPLQGLHLDEHESALLRKFPWQRTRVNSKDGDHDRGPAVWTILNHVDRWTPRGVRGFVCGPVHMFVSPSSGGVRLLQNYCNFT